MRLRSALAAVAGLIALGGCVPVGVPAPSGGTPTVPSVDPSDELGEFRTQQLAWTTCGELECASAQVPLDYEVPGGDRITLAMIRRRASRQPRLGTLFVNPGGPGASGKRFLPGFNPAGLEQYDLVGWDPRGVGESSPVTCLQGKDADAYLEVDTSPDDPAEADALVTAQRDFAQACLRQTGESTLAHISTQETARDLDLMRSMVGDDKLNYVGYSYGTLIGALYADYFPHRVGRLVFDAPVDIVGRTDLPQAAGFDHALQNYAQWCADSGCGLGSTTEEVKAALGRLLDDLDAQPLVVGDRQLTQSLAVSGVVSFFYDGREGWRGLTDAVVSARKGDGAALLASADALNSRDDNGQYGGLFSSFQAIYCADAKPMTRAQVDAQWAADQKAAPFFARYFGPNYACVDWPVPQRPSVGMDAPGTPEILVVGGRGDPATPYQNAVDMAAQLDNARLLTYTGEGHGAYGGSSNCINDAVRRYLVTGEPPADDTTCS